jgi:hypothetical protein
MCYYFGYRAELLKIPPIHTGGNLMKKAFLRAIIALSAAITVFFTACPEESKPESSSGNSGEALITRITIGTERLRPIPEPISSKSLEDEDYTIPGSGPTLGTLLFNVESNMQGVKASIESSKGSKVALAKATSAIAIPDDFDLTLEDDLTFSRNNILWIEVTSKNKKTVNYYRVQMNTRNATSSLGSFSIGTTNVEVPAGNANWAEARIAEVTLTEAQSSVMITATPTSSAAKARIAKFTAEDSPMPVFDDTVVFDISDGDFFAVEVTAENTVSKTYYKFELYINRLKPFVKGADYSIPLAGVATKNATAFPGNYRSFDITLPAYPDGFDIADYTLFTVGAKFFEANGTTEIGSAYGLGQISFLAGTTIIGVHYNLGMATASQSFEGMEPTPMITNQGNPTSVRIQNSSADVRFIEITQIKFHN